MYRNLDLNFIKKMNKNIHIIVLILLAQNLFSQNESRNHYQGNFSLEALGSLGKNNVGGGVMAGYYFLDEQHIRIGGIYRNFEYKDYQENIIEANIDYGYTFLVPNRYDRIFRNFYLTGVGGFAYELVKVKSKVTLIEPYPKYTYASLGINVEYSLSYNASLNLYARQFYALNGNTETLGKYRYDVGFSVKYYIF
jgi:hypothetical protein